MSRFPNLYQIAVESRSSVGANFMTKEQREAQEELRTRFPLSKPSAAILPWYERRDLSATGQTSVALDQGGMSIGTEVPEIGAALRSGLVLEQMGARVFGGLRSDVNFPRGKAGLAAEWLSENAEAAEQSFTFGKLALSPQRITAWIDVSWQLLQQGPACESFIRSELMGALAAEFQRVVIAGTGSSGQPLGILNTTGVGSVVGGTNGLAPTYGHLCNLEYTVTNANADRGNLGWILSPLVRKKLRQTETASGSGRQVWGLDSANSLLGHRAGVTTSAPDNLTKGSSSEVCSAIAFLEMSEVIMCLWGPGVSVEAIRAGVHKSGYTRMVATAYVDGGLRTPEAAAVMLDALCA